MQLAQKIFIMWANEGWSILASRKRMDDLELQVSSPDRDLVGHNGDWGLDPIVRRIRDRLIRGPSHEGERTIPCSLPFRGMAVIRRKWLNERPPAPFLKTFSCEGNALIWWKPLQDPRSGEGRPFPSFLEEQGVTSSSINRKEGHKKDCEFAPRIQEK